MAIIGVAKESIIGEKRVGMTPNNAKALVAEGHTVLVEDGAGAGCGFPNEMYIEAGAEIVEQAKAWSGDILVKVKEPLPSEYGFFHDKLTVWGFLHLAAHTDAVEAMIKAGTSAVGGEVINVNGVLELLQPMSAIAGRRSITLGANYLEAHYDGEGILLSGIDGVEAGCVVIFGGGNAGENAADSAVGLGCEVRISQLEGERFDYLVEKYKGKNVKIIASNEETLRENIKDADLFVSTILIPGAKPPKLVKEDMIKTMKKGSVVIDISIDQGGTVETIDKKTTHDDPIFIKHDVIHYAVPNQPGAVPRTATMALAQGNLEYISDIAKKGITEAFKSDERLKSGMLVYNGKVVHPGLAEAGNFEFVELDSLI